MSRVRTVFTCQNCGASFPKWAGQCAECQQWNTLVEEVVTPPSGVTRKRSGGGEMMPQDISKSLISFSQVDPLTASKRRYSTYIGELDRVLGEDAGGVGVVQGAVMLIGGEPGIGKSTLLTQMVLSVLEHNPHMRIIYACGEENPHQISLRINRILQNRVQNKNGKKPSDFTDRLLFCTSTNCAVIEELIIKEKPEMVIIDSIQTVVSPDLTGSAGSVGQIRECADRLTQVAKAYDIAMWMVGHVTKEGQIAGPKVLEHIVDSVLEFSGERGGELRLLRAIKNRFGATDEVGVFKMTEQGFDSIQNPTELFLEHTHLNVPGSATVCVVEGTRPLLIEVQALLVRSQLAMPRRVGSGIPLSKIQLLSAILEKHCSLPLATTDIFASLVGGFTTKEPSIDLGLAVAMASSYKNKSVPSKTVFIGEIGLLGEVRAVSLLERRVKEAKRLGFTTVISRQTHATIKEVLQFF